MKIRTILYSLRWIILILLIAAIPIYYYVSPLFPKIVEGNREEDLSFDWINFFYDASQNRIRELDPNVITVDSNIKLSNVILDVNIKDQTVLGNYLNLYYLDGETKLALVDAINTRIKKTIEDYPNDKKIQALQFKLYYPTLETKELNETDFSSYWIYKMPAYKGNMRLDKIKQMIMHLNDDPTGIIREYIQKQPDVIRVIQLGIGATKYIAKYPYYENAQTPVL